jgi:8-oxo-dGTP pyrophosphatase MutT (NUDIX family)
MTLIRQGGMICFDEDGERFQLRAAGIAIREGYLLVHRATDEDFWSLPGGRVERNESAAETLTREMIEELQHPAEVGPLLCVIENFFTLAGRRYHEVGFYHRMQPDAGFPFAPNDGVCHRVRDGQSDLEFKWIALTRESLSGARLKPAPLIDVLLSGGDDVRHMVERELVPLPMLKEGGA